MKWFDRWLQTRRIRAIAPHVRPGSRILDIGCADGALFRQVPDFSCYVGVDPDTPPLRPAANIHLIRGTFPTSSLEQFEQFDVITALAVLEHVPYDAQPAFAEACARHLAPGGVLALTVPSPLVDLIINGLKRIRVLDGMCEEQHYGYQPHRTPALFEPHGLELRRHTRFEVGLNHLFVFQARR